VGHRRSAKRIEACRHAAETLSHQTIPPRAVVARACDVYGLAAGARSKYTKRRTNRLTRIANAKLNDLTAIATCLYAAGVIGDSNVSPHTPFGAAHCRPPTSKRLILYPDTFLPFPCARASSTQRDMPIAWSRRCCGSWVPGTAPLAIGGTNEFCVPVPGEKPRSRAALRFHMLPSPLNESRRLCQLRSSKGSTMRRRRPTSLEVGQSKRGGKSRPCLSSPSASGNFAPGGPGWGRGALAGFHTFSNNPFRPRPAQLHAPWCSRPI